MQGDYAQAKLSAWERERAIRLEAKQRREKLEAAKRATAHPAPASHIPKPTAKATDDEEKRPGATPRGAPEKASPCVATKPWLAPKMHSLAAPKPISGKAPANEMMPEVDEDALSVASDSTCSEHGEDDDDDRSACRLADSLDLSVAFATPPKAHAKGPTKAAVSFEKDRAPPTQRTLRHEAPIVSAVPKHAGTVAPARVIATTKTVAGPTDTLRATSAVPAPQVHTLQPAVQPSLGRPLQELAKTSPPAKLAKKLPVPLAEPVQTTPPTQLTKKAQSTEPVKKAMEPTKIMPVVVTKPAAPTDVRATRRPVSPLKPVQGASMSMEEDALRREIAQLDSKLGGLRQDVVSSDEDETPVVAAYGGGAHVRVGTRTAPGDRCSLEKRRAAASVQATRVRKGPCIETPSLEKPAKADKVVVKKEFAFLFM